MNELKLHDIKDIVEIPDISIFIFIALVLLALFIILAFSIFIIKKIKNKKTNERKTYFNILENVNYDDAKEASYTITKALRFLAKNDREIKLANEIIEDLEQYKYKKNVNDIDTIIKSKLSTFMDSVDV